MILFWHPTGPIMKYENGLLLVEDLNPEVKTKWRMSRFEMLVCAWKFLVAAVRG